MAKTPNPFTNELAHARQIINAAEQHAATMAPEVRTLGLDRLTKIVKPAAAPAEPPES